MRLFLGALMYDIVVVGAGPAGSMAAKSAAEKGASVLLVERNAEIGVPLKCGEYMPSLKEMRVLIPNARNLERIYKFPARAIVNHINFVRLISPKGREAEVKFEAMALERKISDKHLAREAARAGAELMVHAEVERLLPGGKGVVVNAEGKRLNIEAKAVIGADGAESIIARQLGLYGRRDPMDIGICFEYEMVGVDSDSDVTEMYFGKNYAPGAFAWIIPKGDGVANVGAGVRTPYMQKGITAQDCLKNLIRHHPAASKKLRRAMPTAAVAGIVPVGGPPPKTFAGNAVVAGDAAGQVIAAVGAGVPVAMICGNIAGTVATAYVKGRGCLAEYEARWRAEVGDVLVSALKIRKITDIIGKSDRVMEYAIGHWLKENLLGKLIRCKFDQVFPNITTVQRLIREIKS